ncbi:MULTISPECIES: ABC transporter ATP-binding protein [unclassified Streptomyces]|uniref:ABC transporter ATP-binding protein n=1 Tax=unclassified Streptomyces TaxID=2593676 RepID=UPI0035E02948
MTAAPATGTPTPPAPPVIELSEVGLLYPGPPRTEALRPTSLSISPGQYVAVVGPSGSGKSSFLNIVGLLDRPTSGRYHMNGSDTAGLSDAERSGLRGREIGFVFQAFHLLPHRSALENVMLPLLYNGVAVTERESRARKALTRVGLGHRIDASPTALSGGERQRVAIARALVTSPSLLLCDELTGNLDSANAASVLCLLDELHDEGHTIVVITHDPGVASRASRILQILDGDLTERTEAA